MNFNTDAFDDKKLLINSDFVELLKFNGIDSAQKLWDLQGEAVKKILKQRGTERVILKTPDGGQLEAYIKRYSKDPIKETVKQAFSLKFRIFDAFHEWKALRAFHKTGLDTMIPMAVASPGKGLSCNLTLGILDYTKAAILFENFTPADHSRKSKLIKSIAEIAGKMHSAGFAHQDFYLVHMFVREKENDKIYLIDLQRLIMQTNLSHRWRVKDLGQLLYSAAPFVSEFDIKRFWITYCKFAGKNFLRDKSLVKLIKSKAAKITARDKKKASKK